STSAPASVPDYRKDIEAGVKGLTLGVPKEYFVEGMDPEVEQAVRGAISTLASDGAKIEEIRLPHTSYAVADYYLIATAEASSNLARYDGVKYGYRSPEAKNLFEMYLETRARGFGSEVKRRIMLGTFALSAGYYDAFYLKAQRVRTLIRRDFEEAFERVSVIVTPTAPTAAFRIGEKTDDPLQMYLSDIYTISVNLAGLPALVVPCGETKSGLPVGLQIIGRPFDEGMLLRVGRAFERASGWRRRMTPW
ncbi:MAG: amidase family protein, partial [Vicinamibacteria bacterium]